MKRLPRRRFLGLVVAPAALGPAGTPSTAAVVDSGQTPTTAPASSIDPQIQRLRAMDIDESVEPALVFLPRE